MTPQEWKHYWRRYVSCYVLAWAIYAGWMIGPFIHQRIFYGSFYVEPCFRAILFSSLTTIIAAAVGLVVAGLLAFILGALMPAALYLRHLSITTATAFLLPLLINVVLTKGDGSIQHGCF